MALPTVTTDRLPALTATLTGLLGNLQATKTRNLSEAIEVGALLIEAKTIVPHGDWAAWLESISLPPRTASRYMSFAKQNGHVADSESQREAEERISGGALSSMAVWPSSVMNTRSGKALRIREGWHNLGLRGEVARDGMGPYGAFGPKFGLSEPWEDGHTPSIFDPVLTQFVYEAYTRPGDTILDPFAGGPTRGIVAAKKDRNYVGIDIRPEQTLANQAQAVDLLRDSATSPIWITGDAKHVLEHRADDIPSADLLFSSPPWGDLEVYSDDPQDLSNMAPDRFENAYRDILGKAASFVACDRFAVIVMGNIRDRHGDIWDLIGLTNDAMRGANCHLYDELILPTPIGSGAIRAPKQWETSRKSVKTHQTVLVFRKGDARAAAQRLPVFGSEDC